ncbi:MAG: glycosyltransferase family 39 protein [bacterium]
MSVAGTFGVLLVGALLQVLLVGVLLGILARMFPAHEAPEASPIERILAAGVVAAGVIVAGVELLGTFHLLDRREAWIAFLAAALALAGGWRVDAGCALAAALGAVVQRFREAQAESLAGRLALGGVGAAWGALILERAFLPPSSWDGVSYHLPYPLHWLQSGELATLFPPVGDPSNAYYPLAGEMLFYWGLLSTGSDLWSSVAQIAPTVLGALALAGIARRCGASRSVALSAGVLWVAVPLVLRLSVEPMVDLLVADFMFSAIYFLLQALDAPRTRPMLLAGAALGLAAGTKYVGALYVLAVLPLGLHALSRYAGVHGTGAAARALVLGLLIAGGLGGYVYARNIWIGGNPILPMAVSFAGVDVLPGPRPATAFYASAAHEQTLRSLVASVRSLLDLGPWLAWFLLCPVFGLLVSHRRGSSEGRTLAHVAVAALLVLGLFLVLPYREHRHLLILAGLSAVITATVARRPGLVAVLAAAQLPPALYYWGKDAVLAGVSARHWIALPVAVWLLAATTVRFARPGAVPSRTISRHGVAIVAAVVVVGAALGATVQEAYEARRLAAWKRYWSNRYESEGRRHRVDLAGIADAWQRLDELAAGEPVTVAYTGNNLPYPLAGRGLRRRVRFVPLNDQRAAAFVCWGTEPASLVDGGTASAWIANLEALGVEWFCAFRRLAADDPETAFPPETEWAEARPERFEKVHENDWARIYRVR